MFQTCWKMLSLGGRYFPAIVMYTGLGLVLWGTLPNPPSALAACDGPEEGCSEGEICCDGTCVPNWYVCCEDGSSGDSGFCACCTGCVDSTCTELSTVVCADPE